MAIQQINKKQNMVAENENCIFDLISISGLFIAKMSLQTGFCILMYKNT